MKDMSNQNNASISDGHSSFDPKLTPAPITETRADLEKLDKKITFSRMGTAYTCNQELPQSETKVGAAAQEKMVSALASTAPTPPSELDDPKEYPVAPFNLNKDDMEHIGLNSGNLGLTVTDFVLPGRNGFDLALTRRYSSSMSNESELTPRYERQERYTWRIDLTATVFDYALNKTVRNVSFWVYDTLGMCGSKSEALQAAKDAWEDEWESQLSVGSYTEYSNYDTGFDHLCRITSITKPSYSTSYLGIKDIVYSDTRPNDHLTNTYGLGLGWGFGFPSIEIVGEAYKKKSVRYYNYLHLEDGQVYKLEGTELKDYKLKDITFSRAYGTVSGKQYNYTLSYKDGKTAYFYYSQSIYKLIAMSDRFGNTISFDLSPWGGTITDTMGRPIVLSRAAIANGYTLTWTLPDGNRIVYTVENGMLTKVRDQAGRETVYNYGTGSLFKSYMSSEFGDDGVHIPYKPLTDITYPTGAKSKYTYEFFDYYRGGTLQGTQAMLLIRQCTDYENTGAVKSRQDYWHQTAWKTMDSDYDMRLYIKQAQASVGQRVNVYDFAYQKPVSKQVTKVGGVMVRERSIPYYLYDQLPTREVVKRFQNGKTLTSESSWNYDNKGNLLSETLPIAGTTTYTYDSAYSLPLSKVYSKDSGTQIREEYSLRSDKKLPEWKKVYEKGELKEATLLQYDGNNNLSTERRYTNLNLVPSADDRVTAYSYANTNPQLEAWRYDGVFLTEKRVSGVKNVDGTALSDVVERYICDAHGRVLEKTDPNKNTTKFTYDGLGRITKELYPDGAWKETQYIVSASQNHIVETEKDSGGSVLRSKRLEYTSLGKAQRVYMLGPDTLLSYYSYDTQNRLSYEYAYGTEGTTTTVYTYDAFDRIASKTTTGPDMPSYQEKYTYDDAFDPVRQYTKESKEVVGDGSAPTVYSSVLKDVLARVREETVGSSTTLTAYDFVGNIISQTDPNGNTVTFTYDYAGKVRTETRLAEVYQPGGSVQVKSVVATTVYDALGNKRSFTDFRGKGTNLSYDVLGRLLEQKVDLSGPDKMITRYAYDSAGNVTSQRVLSSGGVWRETAYTYDSSSRVLDTIVNDGKTETRTRFGYDAVGNKTIMYTGMLGNSIAGAQKTTYTYDRFGNMKTMADPIGNEPNPPDPSRRTEVYNYDSYGQLRSKKDRNGDTTTYKYDGLGRLRSERAVDSEGKQPDAFRNYSYSKTGQKATEDNGDIRVTFTYDNMGRLVTQTETCLSGAANTVVKRYGYDAGSNRISFTMTKDNVTQISLTYEYGKLNRLKNLWKNGIHIAAYTYDENGNRKTLTYPQSGISTEYFYNDTNLVTDLYNRKNGVHRSSYHYSYALDGNQSCKISKVAGHADKITDYLYDRLGRLTEEKEQNGSKIIYEYDRFSNRAKMTVTDVNGKKTVTTYEYDPRNRLETESKVDDKGVEEILHYRHDFNGNQIYREWERFTPRDPNKKYEPGRVGFYSDKFKQDVVILEMREYNGFNQLVYLYRDTLETRYTYRPDGLRQKKLFADGSSHTHIWDGQNIVAEYVANGNVVVRYHRGINLVAREMDGLLQYYIFNAHGDVTERCDHNGTTLKNYEYDAFGVEKNPEILDANPFRYCAEYYDREADTVYLRARNYSAYNGKMLSEDSVRSFSSKLPNGLNAVDPLSLNLYLYCYNNPLRFVDPSGCFSRDTVGSFFQGVGAGLMESFSFGLTSSMDSNFARTNENAYLVGKVVAGAAAGYSGMLIVEGGAGIAVGTAPTGVGVVAGGAVATAGLGVTASGSAVAISSAAQLIVRNSGGSGGGNKNSWGTIDDLIEAANAIVNGNNTAVGRAFQKHAIREGTAFVGEITGNAAKNTSQGMDYLNMILNDPNSSFTIRDTRAYGSVVDVRMQNGMGARWTADGKKFIGFLELYTKK